MAVIDYVGAGSARVVGLVALIPAWIALQRYTFPHFTDFAPQRFRITRSAQYLPTDLLEARGKQGCSSYRARSDQCARRPGRNG